MTSERFLDVEKYEVIGSGGFGLIAKSPDKNTVMKFFYLETACINAKEESELHRLVYAKILEIEKKYPDLMIYTSVPIAYRNSPLTFQGDQFRCAYEMSYIPSIPNYNELVHIILKEEYKDKLNKVVGRNYNQTPGKKNPARGFFATGSYIEKNILPVLPDRVKGEIRTLPDLVYRSGILCGICIFGAQLVPTDAEYVLSIRNDKLHVAILDFGMFQHMNLENFIDVKHKVKILDKYVYEIKSINGIDLYFPYEESELYKPFQDGMSLAWNFFVSNVENKVIQESLRYIGVHLGLKGWVA
jgi:hypothetical protein